MPYRARMRTATKLASSRRANSICVRLRSPPRTSILIPSRKYRGFRVLKVEPGTRWAVYRGSGKPVYNPLARYFWDIMRMDVHGCVRDCWCAGGVT